MDAGLGEAGVRRGDEGKVSVSSGEAEKTDGDRGIKEKVCRVGERRKRRKRRE